MVCNRFRALIALACSCLATGCASAGRHASQAKELEAERLFLSDRTTEAQGIYEELALDHPDPDRRGHFRIRVAQCAAIRGSSASDAIERLEELLANPDGASSPVLARAHAVLGEIHRRAGRDADAREYLSRALAVGEAYLKKDEILLALARVSMRLGDWTGAGRGLERILIECSESSCRAQARELLAYRFYSIQVGAFRSAPRARELARRLDRSGVPAFLETSNAESGDLYAVRVGRYSNWREAEGARESLVRSGRLEVDAFLVPR